MLLKLLADVVTSRGYNATAAFVSLIMCWKVSVGSYALSSVFQQVASLIVLSLDACLRYLVFGIDGHMDFLNVTLTAGAITCGLFDILFGSIAYLSLQPVISAAFAIRSAVCVQHFVLRRNAVKPILRRITVESRGQNGSKDVSSSRDLDICYVTSRLLAVSRVGPSSKEHEFLEAKYANFLRQLPALDSGVIPSFTMLSSIVEGAVIHLLSNPVNVVVINSPPGDMNAVLLICALLIRTGAVTSGKASAALDVYLSRRYVIGPDVSQVLSRNLYSLLKTFETIMTRSPQPVSVSWSLRRVVISQLDTSAFVDLRLAVVDVGSGKVFNQNVSPSISVSSITFLCPCNITSDTLLVFTDSAAGNPVMKVYVNPMFHFQRTLASQSTYTYVLYSDDCDQWTTRMASFSARIEIFATNVVESTDSVKLGIDMIDKEMLSLPPSLSRRDSTSCAIV